MSDVAAVVAVFVSGGRVEVARDATKLEAAVGSEMSSVVCTEVDVDANESSGAHGD